MSGLIKNQVNEALTKATHASQNEGAYSYLPAIIDALDQMHREAHADSDARSKLAGALGRLVTEDYTFSESPLGQTLLKLANDFAA